MTESNSSQHTWQPGELITDSKLNNLEETAGSLKNEIQTARNGANSLKESLDTRFNSIVTIGDEPPSITDDFIWAKTSSNTFEVPELEDLQAFEHSFAPEYSDQKSYAVGDYCVHKHKLYKCHTAYNNKIFQPDKWTELTITECLDDLQASLDVSMMKRGVLDDNINLNNIIQPGLYALASTRTYTGIPSDFSNSLLGELEVLQFSDSICMQRLTDHALMRQWIRVTSVNNFQNKDWISTNRIQKFISYGDDFNTYVNSGVYYFFPSSDSNKIYINAPDLIRKGTYCILEVLNYPYRDDDENLLQQVFQRITVPDTDTTFTRRAFYSNGIYSWNPWNSVMVNNSLDSTIPDSMRTNDKIDFNKILTPGTYAYIANYISDYVNIPEDAPNESAILEVFNYFSYTTNAIYCQRLTYRTSGKVYFRSTLNASFENRVWIQLNKEPEKELTHKNYYEEGTYDLNDIITEGSYWFTRKQGLFVKNAPWTTDNDNGTSLYDVCGGGAMLEVTTPTDSTAVIYQRVTMLDGRIYSRSSSSTDVWYNWKSENNDDDILKTLPTQKSVVRPSSTAPNVTITCDNNTFTFNGTVPGKTSDSNVTASVTLFYSITSFPCNMQKNIAYKLKAIEENTNPSLWCYCYFYNNSTTAISSVSVGAGAQEKIFFIPEEATGMSIFVGVTNASTSNLNVNKSVTLSLTPAEKSNIRNAKRKYVAFGDSNWKGAVWWPEENRKQGGSNPTLPYYARTEYQYTYQIAAALGLEDNYENFAIGGTGYLKPSADNAHDTYFETIQAHTDSFEEDCIVTIGGGGNDRYLPLGWSGSRANSELIDNEGNLLDQNSPLTICGAVKDIIAYFKQNYPKITLIIAAPLAGGGNGSTVDVWNNNFGGQWSYNEWEQEVSTICKNNHIGYISFKDLPYMDKWNSINKGYSSYSASANYSHPINERGYLINANYLAAKISGQTCDYVENIPNAREYTKNDLHQGGYFIMSYPSKAFNIYGNVNTLNADRNVVITSSNVSTYYKACNGFHKDSGDYVRHLLVPIYKGDKVFLHTVGGGKYAGAKNSNNEPTSLGAFFYGDTEVENASPAAVINNGFIQTAILSNYTIGKKVAYEGNFEVTEDGFLAINCNTANLDDFACRIYSGEYVEDKNKTINLPVYDSIQNKYLYKEDATQQLTKSDLGAASAIHNWAVIGASFDSGEFNFKLASSSSTIREFDAYDYSCWSIFQKINGIPKLYHYADGGQNVRDWLLLDPASTDSDVGGHKGRSYYYEPHPEDPDYIEKPFASRWGRGGANGNGGCWWKLREDFCAGKNYQAFIINLGSNDINNNFPRYVNPGDYYYNWNEGTYDTALGQWRYFNGSTNPVIGSVKDYYKAGTLADIGTYTLQYTTNLNGTRTITLEADTLPSTSNSSDAIISPFDTLSNIIHSYAGYMSAILNRIIAMYPKALIFLCTIRNGFTETDVRYNIWQEYNQVLRDLATDSRYSKNVILIDNGTFGPNYHTYPQYNFYVYYHPNAMGYYNLAIYWNKLIDAAMQENKGKVCVSDCMFNDLEIYFNE